MENYTLEDVLATSPEAAEAAQDTDKICKAILKAFEANEYLNIADFRLLAGDSDSQGLTTAINYLLEQEYMVDMDADCYDDIDTGNAETIYAAVKPIGQRGKE
jgi:hypothetical protein